MVVLHARWSGAAVAVWGEHAPGVRATGDASESGDTGGSAPSFPGHLTYVELTEAAAPLRWEPPEPVRIEVEIPAGGGVPWPSPWAGGPDEAGPPASTAAVVVDALTFPAAALLDLPAGIEALAGRRVQAADSLRWLAAAAGVAVDLCAAGRFVPSLILVDGSYESRWMAAPAVGDDRVDVLAASAPPALGACADEVVDVLVDAVARDCLHGSDLKKSRRADTVSVWLAGLRAAIPEVLAADAGAGLADRLAAWAFPDAGSAALQTCLRLVPPTVEDPCVDAWRIEFLLRARDDPSLLVAAADVWAEAGTLEWFGRTYEPPQDRLLADLGRAARLWPPLAPALDTALPEALEVDAGTALAFLRDGVALFEAAGIDVQVPAVFGATTQLGIRLRVRPARTPARSQDGARAGGVTAGSLGAEGICEYDWSVAIGDEVLDEAELVRLASLKQPLVRHRGQWVSVDIAAVEAAAKFVAAGRDHGTLSGIDALRAAAGLDAPDLDLAVVDVDAEGWVGDLVAGGFAPGPRPTPAGFAGELRPYQQRGLGWLRFMSDVGLGAVLADDMGLGKTAQLLALLADECEAGVRRGPTLLVCPTSVLGNWQSEAARFTPGLDVLSHYGPDRARGDTLATVCAAADLVITTYGVLSRDVEALRACEFDRVVLDEAQLVKNSASGASRAARAVPARHHVALTGTPVENRLGDLWSIMEFANAGLLGSAAGFRRAFAVPIERYRDEDAAALLARLTRPFVLRRVKTDREIAPDLPDKTEVVERCALTREQATLYQAVVDDMLAAVGESEGVQRRGLVLATIAKLKAVCNHPAQLLGDASPLENRSGKLVRLEELLEGVLATGERALVFTQFAAFGARLARHVRDTFGVEVPYLHGGVNQQAREALVRSFQSATGAPVMLLSLRAGGVGLNLTAASHVIHYDRWWNPAVEDQATDRAHRIGAHRDVMVRKLVCRGTIEDRIDAVLEAKRGLADAVIGTGEDWLTSLDVEELRELVDLARDAVDEGDGL